MYKIRDILRLPKGSVVWLEVEASKHRALQQSISTACHETKAKVEMKTFYAVAAKDGMETVKLLRLTINKTGTPRKIADNTPEGKPFAIQH